MSVYITSLLHKYDSSIEIVPKLKGDKLTEAYNKLIEFTQNDKSNKLPSFESNAVSKDYMKFLSEILDIELTLDMPYVSFDCSVIFWSEKYFTKKEIPGYVQSLSSISQSISHSITTKHKNINNQHYDEDCFMGIRMINNKSNNEFDVFVAHIKSGESSEAEYERVESIKKLLNNIRPKVGIGVALNNHVLCMDSNTSELYQNNFNKSYIYDKKSGSLLGKLDKYANEIWKGYKYKNHIPQNKNTICWKMRAGSRQEDKNGAIMADRIDVILTPKHIFAKYFSPIHSNITDYDYKYIMAWRTNEKYRNAIKNECIQNKWENNNKNNKVSEELAEMLIDPEIENKYTNTDKTSVEKVTDIFNKLYPNIYMPSDHPMIGAVIYFSIFNIMAS